MGEQFQKLISSKWAGTKGRVTYHLSRGDILECPQCFETHIIASIASIERPFRCVCGKVLVEEDGLNVPFSVDFQTLPSSVQVLLSIAEERMSQEQQHGETNQANDLMDYSQILASEMVEMNEAIHALRWMGEGHFKNNHSYHLTHLQEELVQVAAVAVQIVEWLGEKRDKSEPGDLQRELFHAHSE